MSTTAAKPLFQRQDVAPLASLLVIALSVAVTSTCLGVAGAGIALSSIGVFFDGHMYIEIAKSFPLPYAPEGRFYLGHAPGYPAIMYLGRLLTPDIINWGLLAILVTWIAATLSAGAFYLLCKEAGVSPFLPSALFVVMNPIWVTRAASPHSEPLAMLFVLLCILALLREELGWSVLWLSLASLVRVPAILIGASLAFRILIQRRDWRVRNLLILSVPLIVLGLYNLYLYLRIPGFTGVWNAHQIFWIKHFTWPFAALIQSLVDTVGNPPRIRIWPMLEVTCFLAVVYLVSIGAGFRRHEKELWILPVWVAVIVFFHASLSGAKGAQDFGRLTLLAWPASLLIIWRWVGVFIPSGAVVAFGITMGIASVWFAQQHIRMVVRMQQARQVFLLDSIKRLDSNEPRWVINRLGGSRRRGR